MKKTKYLMLGLLIALTVSLTGCNLLDNKDDNKDEDKKEQSNDIKENEISEKEIIIYAEEDGQNAYELLKKYVTVEVEEYDFGVMIKAINGLEADNTSYFWGFYVNGEMSMTGVDSTTLQKGDEMKWVYEEVKPM